MTDDIAVKVENVSKMYRLFASKGDRIREALHPLRRPYHRQFWALKDINLEIPAGRTVGILGLNGSGKSTLLQIIASVLQPTTGTVRVNGKVAALLELGAGFNPELTGRENVILNGTMMGLARDDIRARMPDIEAFADIGEFFDQPMRSYSSGMFMRVAFSTALYVDPDILSIDEVLAVGDARFQEKCFRRFKGFQEAGKTILFVTHDRMAVPRHCDTGILLHKGELLAVGEPRHIADLYGELLTFGHLRPRQVTPPPVPGEAARLGAVTDRGVEEPVVDEVAGRAAPPELAAVLEFINARPDHDRCPSNPTYNNYEYRFGNGHAQVIDYMIVSGETVNPASLYSGTTIDIYLKVLFRQDVEAPIVGVGLRNKEGILAYSVNTEWMNERVEPVRAGGVGLYRFTMRLSLCAGDWFLELATAETRTEICDCRTALAHLYLMETLQYAGLARLETTFTQVRLPRPS